MFGLSLSLSGFCIFLCLFLLAQKQCLCFWSLIFIVCFYFITFVLFNTTLDVVIGVIAFVTILFTFCVWFYLLFSFLFVVVAYFTLKIQQQKDFMLNRLDLINSVWLVSSNDSVTFRRFFFIYLQINALFGKKLKVFWL